jgi:pimeloyl-ACP methyl ester carboxylesterase
MLEFKRDGAGESLLLLHGTPSSARAWEPLVPDLTHDFEVLRPDFPGFGASPPIATDPTPQAFADEVERLLDTLGWERPQIAGHSMGGWVALELAKRGRASAVVALAPAGLWRGHSPRLTDLRLNAGLKLGRRTPRWARGLLRYAPVRSVALRDASAHPADVPAALALAAADDTADAVGWARHFRAARTLRFRDGQQITIPVTVAFGDRDRIAIPSKSQNRDELPSHTRWITLPDCGHLVQWDAPDRALQLIRSQAGHAQP